MSRSCGYRLNALGEDLVLLRREVTDHTPSAVDGLLQPRPPRITDLIPEAQKRPQVSRCLAREEDLGKRLVPVAIPLPGHKAERCYGVGNDADGRTGHIGSLSQFV